MGLIASEEIFWIDPYSGYPNIFIRWLSWQPCLVTTLSHGNPVSWAININPGYKVDFLQQQEEEEEERKELNDLGLQIFANVLLPTASPQISRCGLQREILGIICVYKPCSQKIHLIL
jgi:hypothetical protein